MSDEASSFFRGRRESPHGRATGKPAPEKTHGLEEANFKGLPEEGLQQG